MPCGRWDVGSNSGYRQTSIIDLGWSLAIGKCAVAARCWPQVLILYLQTSSQSGQERDELTHQLLLPPLALSFVLFVLLAICLPPKADRLPSSCIYLLAQLWKSSVGSDRLSSSLFESLRGVRGLYCTMGTIVQVSLECGSW